MLGPARKESTPNLSARPPPTAADSCGISPEGEGGWKETLGASMQTTRPSAPALDEKKAAADNYEDNCCSDRPMHPPGQEGGSE